MLNYSTLDVEIQYFVGSNPTRSPVFVGSARIRACQNIHKYCKEKTFKLDSEIILM